MGHGKVSGSRQGVDEMLHAVRAGEMTFDAFARTTMQRWNHLAARLLSRWRHPPTVTQEDMLQEILLGIWRAATRRGAKGWDPKRGTALKTWVLYSACTEAKRWLHKQRGASIHGHAGGNPSRFARTFGSMQDGDRTYEDVEDLLANVVAAQDDEIDNDWLLTLVPGVSSTARGQAALGHVVRAQGDVAKAARAWYADPSERLRHEMDSERDAERMVRVEVGQIRRKMERLVNAP